jgi:hypothetical protein
MHLCTLYEYKYSMCAHVIECTVIHILCIYTYIYICVFFCMCIYIYVCMYIYDIDVIYYNRYYLASTSIPKPFPGARLRRGAVGLRSHVQRQPLARRRSVCRVADRQSWGRSTARGHGGMILRSGFL